MESFGGVPAAAGKGGAEERSARREAVWQPACFSGRRTCWLLEEQRRASTIARRRHAQQGFWHLPPSAAAFGLPGRRLLPLQQRLLAGVVHAGRSQLLLRRGLHSRSQGDASSDALVFERSPAPGGGAVLRAAPHAGAIAAPRRRVVARRTGGYKRQGAVCGGSLVPMGASDDSRRDQDPAPAPCWRAKAAPLAGDGPDGRGRGWALGGRVFWGI